MINNYHIVHQKYHIKSKIDQTFNFQWPNLHEWHQNLQLQIFIQANLTMGKKLKTCQEQPHLVCSHFIEVFYKTTTFLDNHF